MSKERLLQRRANIRIGLSLLLGVLLVLGGMLPALASPSRAERALTVSPAAAMDGADAAQDHDHGHDQAELPDGARHHLHHDASWPDHVHEAMMPTAGLDLPRHVPLARQMPVETHPPSGPRPKLERPPRALG